MAQGMVVMCHEIYTSVKIEIRSEGGMMQQQCQCSICQSAFSQAYLCIQVTAKGTTRNDTGHFYGRRSRSR